MRHTNDYERLTDPEATMDPAYRHISYALFRMDDDFGRVIAMRFPATDILSVGNVLQRQLSLPGEAVTELLSIGGAAERGPLFCLTQAGVGLLCKSYQAAAGLGLYVHIHCRPDAAVRLLCANALGTPSDTSFRLTERIRSFAEPPKRGDTASFAALLDAWRAVQLARGGLFVPSEARGAPHADATRGTVCQMPVQLAQVIERMAAFAGCSVDCRVAPEIHATPLALHRPLLLEALLLYLLTEVHTYAEGQMAVVEIRSVEDPRSRWERRLELSVSCRIDTLHMPIRTFERLEETHAYLTDVADRSGLQVQFPKLAPPDLRAIGSHKREDYLFRQAVTLEWLTDPAVLPSGDLKAPNGYEAGEERGF